MPDTSALFDSGQHPGIVAAEFVAGGSPITTAGRNPGSAATDVAGVAAGDTPAGKSVTVRRGTIERGIASGAITNGDPLCTAAPATTGAPARLRRWVAGTDAVAARIARAWSSAADGGTVTYALIGV